MTTAAARPELLAPAGDWDSLRAACAAGADAVYFGLREFSARARAVNFAPAELPPVMDFLRARNVRGYVALNTLIFSEELERAAELVRAVAEAGADAAIVQDLGLARLARRMCPTLPVHASTQMTLADAAGIELARRLAGIARVILPRELSVGQIARIAAATDVPLEVFVHGALCISYGGQCLASLRLGGRSGNRGQCAQPCRLPYEIAGSTDRSRSHPLSPLDLAGWERFPELVRLGVRGFKIEGRLKNAYYVSAATAAYRRALDAALAGRSFALAPDEQAGLDLSFSRGFTRGFLGGASGAELVPGRALQGRKTDDPARRARAAHPPASRRPARLALLSVRLLAPLGGALEVVVADEAGREARVSWPGPLERAAKHPLSEALVREQFGRLGGTPFALGPVTIAAPEPAMVPKSVLNDLRRQAVARLTELRAAAARHAVAEPDALARLRREAARAPLASRPSSTALNVLVRSLEQLDAVLAWRPPAGALRPALVWCDLAATRLFAKAVEMARAAGLRAGLAAPRIIEPGDEGVLEAVAAAAPDAVLARNLSTLEFFGARPGRPELVGDFSLNAANELAAAALFDAGLARLTPAADLDLARLRPWLVRAGAARCEVVIHSHPPLFHAKHCLFAAERGEAAGCQGCKRPCEGAPLRLRDRLGVEHPVLADALGRNTVFHGESFSAAGLVSELRAAGVRHFRVELLTEAPAQIAALLDHAASLLG